MTRTSVSLLLLMMSAFSSIATAESDGRVEFEKANAFFEAGEYEAALPYYKQAYERSGKRASTIRALAQCERALRLYDDAITHFREYLATGPEEAPQIQDTINLLEELRETQRREERDRRAAEAAQPPVAAPPQQEAPVVAAPAPAPIAEPAKEEGGTSPLVWVAIAAAVVGGGVALGFALSGEREPYGGTLQLFLRR